jgi:hypothetical protein
LIRLADGPVAADGVQIPIWSGGQLAARFVAPPPEPPGRTPHGAEGVCVIADGDIVVIIPDGVIWDLAMDLPRGAAGRARMRPGSARARAVEGGAAAGPQHRQAADLGSRSHVVASDVRRPSARVMICAGFPHPRARFLRWRMTCGLAQAVWTECAHHPRLA